MPKSSPVDNYPPPRYPGAINRRDNGRFTSVSGYPDRKSIGTFDSWREAEDALARHCFSQVGRPAFEIQGIPTPKLPLDLFLETYIEARRDDVRRGMLQRRSLQDIEQRLSYAIYDLGYRGHNDMERLTSEEVATWMRSLITVGSTHPGSRGPLSAVTARKCLVALHQALQIALRHGQMSLNPAVISKGDLPTPEVDYGDGSDYGNGGGAENNRWPDAAEARAFLIHIENCPRRWGKRQAGLWHLAAETGMRCGELAGVSKSQGDVADVEWDNSVLNIRRALGVDGGTIFVKSPKSENGRRTIGLTERTVTKLREHMERVAVEATLTPEWLEQVEVSDARGTGTRRVDLMFRDHLAGALNPTNVSQGFIAEWNHAGLRRGVSLHGLRHLHASILLEGDQTKGIPPWSIDKVGERLGIDSAMVKKTYAHILKRIERARHGVEDIDRLYGSAW